MQVKQILLVGCESLMLRVFFPHGSALRVREV